MNDTQYLEASRHLAYNTLKADKNLDKRIKLAFRKVSSRLPDAEEVQIMNQVIEAHKTHYKSNAQEAKEIISHGDSAVPTDIETAELAAWTMLCSQLYNLDETITKE